MTRLEQTVDDGGGLPPGLELLLLLRQLLLKVLELSELLHHLGLLGSHRLPLCLNFGGRPATLRANLEHVGAGAMLE